MAKVICHRPRHDQLLRRRHGRRDAQVHREAEGARTTPFDCAVTEDGERIVGQPAKTQASPIRNGPFFAVKLLVRTALRRPDGEEKDKKLVPYKITKASKATPEVEADGRAIRPRRFHSLHADRK